jgi:hypothetical protein
MAITLPQELEEDVLHRAEQLGVEPAEIVRRALVQFLHAEPELEAELRFWQQHGQEAWATVEESLR